MWSYFRLFDAATPLIENISVMRTDFFFPLCYRCVSHHFSYFFSASVIVNCELWIQLRSLNLFQENFIYWNRKFTCVTDVLLLSFEITTYGEKKKHREFTVLSMRILRNWTYQTTNFIFCMLFAAFPFSRTLHHHGDDDDRTDGNEPSVDKTKFTVTVWVLELHSAARVSMILIGK